MVPFNLNQRNRVSALNHPVQKHLSPTRVVSHNLVRLPCLSFGEAPLEPVKLVAVLPLTFFWKQAKQALTGLLLEGFTEAAIQNLCRYGFPFTPFLHQVGVVGKRPSPPDSIWSKMQATSQDGLQKWFNNLKEAARELVYRLSQG
ncbi:hypothetical protein JXQ70_06600 [bacterium]|nr:hypothetical protein [bacterium]